MKPIVPDLSEPLLSPRRVRRTLIVVLCVAALVALSTFLMTHPDPMQMWEGSR